MNSFATLRVSRLKSPSGFVPEGRLNQLVHCCEDLGSSKGCSSARATSSIRCCVKTDLCLAETDFHIDIISFNVFKTLYPDTTCRGHRTSRGLHWDSDLLAPFLGSPLKLTGPDSAWNSTLPSPRLTAWLLASLASEVVTWLWKDISGKSESC